MTQFKALFFQFYYKISEILSWSAFGNQCCTRLSFHLLIQQMLIVSLLRADNIIGFRARIVSRHLHSLTQCMFYHGKYSFEPIAENFESN